MILFILQNKRIKKYDLNCLLEILNKKGVQFVPPFLFRLLGQGPVLARERKRTIT